jgi:hypothetical protein
LLDGALRQLQPTQRLLKYVRIEVHPAL